MLHNVRMTGINPTSLDSPRPSCYNASIMEQATIEQLQKAVGVMPEIMAVYVFGSFAKGQETKESDFDLAFVVENRKKIDTHRIYDALDKVHLPADLDIVVVDASSPPLLLFEIISSGKLIFTRSEKETTDFEANTLKSYYDNTHIRKIYYEYLKEKFPVHYVS